MDIKKQYEKYLICPKCRGNLNFSKTSIKCQGCGKKYNFLDNDMPDLFEENDSNRMSLQKWEEVFQDEFFQKKAEEEFVEVFLEGTLKQLLRTTSKKKGVYLEIGCGQGFIGEALAKRGWFFVGVDYSRTALLQLKKRLEKRGITNFMLFRADINELPLKDNLIDLIYGGGVIEHLKDCNPVVSHLYRVLKSKGVAFNTVPFFNVGNLVYRSFWGGIPNIPVLKQIAEFIHIKLLSGKHMVFGYELQFTESQLINMHLRAGFKRVSIEVDNFECHIHVHKLKNLPHLRKFFINLCKTNRNFWPMVKVIARKL